MRSKIHRKHHFGRPLFVLLLVGSSTQWIPAASLDGLCGLTVGANVKLTHDLTCSGDGLNVGADRVEINLNGHTISGSAIGVGISVTGRNDVTIVGGTVKNFSVGVRLNTSTNVVIEDDFQ